MFNDAETQKGETAAPGSTVLQHRDMKRASRQGANTFGWLYNAVGSLISKNWGFHVARDIDATGMKVMVSYNLGDPQTGSKELLPRNPHGEWLAKHFSENAAACKVCVGGSEDPKAGNQHGAQMPKMLDGTAVAQLVAM